MGGLVHTGSTVVTHDVACQKAESTRQSAVAGAASSAAGQVVVNNAEIAFARAVIASCIANNSSAGLEAYQSLLRALGTGGS
jgi:replication-associated recombination protein RarA